MRILDTVIEKAPELMLEADDEEVNFSPGITNEDITIDTIRRIVEWDRKNRKLKDYHFKYMSDVADGKLPFTETAKGYAKTNLTKLKRYGFE